MAAKHPPPPPLRRTPLFAAAVLCHLLVLGLVIDTRLHLADPKSTARRGLSVADGGSSSAPLLNDDDGGAGGDPFATAAELAELKAALAEQVESLSTLKTDTAELGRQLEGLSQTRTRDDSNDDDDEMLDRFMTSMRAEMAELRADCSSHTEQDPPAWSVYPADASSASGISGECLQQRRAQRRPSRQRRPARPCETRTSWGCG